MLCRCNLLDIYSDYNFLCTHRHQSLQLFLSLVVECGIFLCNSLLLFFSHYVSPYGTCIPTCLLTVFKTYTTHVGIRCSAHTYNKIQSRLIQFNLDNKEFLLITCVFCCYHFTSHKLPEILFYFFKFKIIKNLLSASVGIYTLHNRY